mmetsp:Transcript_16888/g.21365  ORF Transcript_16888/g.21365 Transcript_16888/m.21365 type:complete len:291 (-) Transcript_16888:67-939(-)|eukprot:CAMPEP_0203669384 /NCGR_PEP_ID=MMETSP0090-20130426/5784_1 /ASSEMBLY_ACC=CAM_ASM_001088 /TAXON_ID=426623 /ORGANISM="Chaetoceros affinis, Strain CCMP159" /LENGTH=290 /DNA_ID=CAMNT_0050534069 /DNA_START=62 /DNA_END=934 /DNA_ORIENTATION=+
MSSGPTTALTSYNPSGATSLSDNSNNGNQKTITLDSLPYIDNIHPDYEAYALTLIEEEMQKMDQEKDESKAVSSSSDDFLFLRHLPNPLGTGNSADSTPSSFLTKAEKTSLSLNKTEYEDLVARNGQPRTDKVDYKMKMMESSSIAKKLKSKGKKATQEEWEGAIEKAKVELEYERLRMVNAELQSEYESSLWKHHAQKLEAISSEVKEKLSKQQMAVDQINAQRQDAQTVKGGPKLQILSQNWDEGLKRVSLLADGVEKLTNEVEGLRSITGANFAKDEKSQESDDDDL